MSEPISRLTSLSASERFQTGSTVTIKVLNKTTHLEATLTSNVCTEIGTTGIFTWSWNNLQTKPTTFGDYAYIMTDGTNENGDDVVFDNTLDQILATVGVATGASAVTITIKDQSLNAIPDVGVNIFNSDNTVLITNGVTNDTGQIIFNLNDGAYKVRLIKAQVNFTPVEDLTVAGDGGKEYSGTTLTITPPQDASLCRLYAFARDQSSKSVVDFKGTARVINDTAINGAYLFKEPVQASRDLSTGEFYWIIPQGVTVEVQGLTHFERRTVVVPNTATAVLPDLPNA